LLKVDRLIAELRAAQQAAPLCPNGQPVRGDRGRFVSSIPPTPKGKRSWRQKAWTPEEVKEMEYLLRAETKIKVIALRLGRTQDSIWSKIRHGRRKRE
jgi:hypothetical protein